MLAVQLLSGLHLSACIKLEPGPRWQLPPFTLQLGPAHNGLNTITWITSCNSHRGVSGVVDIYMHIFQIKEQVVAEE